METYNILFSVQFGHTYYEDGKCYEIAARPDHATVLLIKKYGFFYKQDASGFSIIARCIIGENNKAMLSSEVEINLQFNFILSLKNPYLMNITKLPELEDGAFNLYSNTRIDSEKGDAKTHFFEDGQSVEIMSRSFKADENSSANIELQKSGKTYPLGSGNINAFGEYNIEGLDLGVYNYKSTIGEKYIYLSNEAFPTKPFSLISIELDNDTIINAEKNILQPIYRLQLQTKETFWRYIIRKKDTTENLVVESSNNTVLFTKTEEELSGNEAVIVFTSKQKIPITAVRDSYFKLKLRNGDPENDLTLISKLPLPDMNVLNKTQDGTTYSPIYLNF